MENETYTQDAQRFVEAARLVAEAGKLVYPLNSFGGISIMHQAMALLQEAANVNAVQRKVEIVDPSINKEIEDIAKDIESMTSE
jgi:hypothetical protein